MIVVRVLNCRQSETLHHSAGAVVIGRNPQGGCTRLRLKDPTVSSQQLMLTPQPGNQVRIKNLSKRVPVRLDEEELQCECEILVSIPVRLQLGESLIVIEAEGASGADDSVQTIAAPISQLEISPEPPRALDGTTIVRWFEALTNVQRAAARTTEFFAEAARAVVNLIGFDIGLVLTRSDSDWVVQAEASPNGNDHKHFVFSRNLLQRVVEQRRTFFHAPKDEIFTESLAADQLAVASPVFSADGEQVIGAIYGIRCTGLNREDAGIRPLDAQLVQVLSTAVSAGLARQESEALATRRQIQFEQFVSPEIAQELDRNPDLLTGRECEITAMFADIRNFSAVSQALEASTVCELIGDIMEMLGTCVRDTNGTTVSYLGDGLLAIWNAPVEQTDHASRAAEAAIGILNQLPALNTKWCEAIGDPLQFGVGMNTGMATVGNTGSRFKPQYGPLGHEVNLASRVEGATKQIGVPVLITAATCQSLGDEFAVRRLCRAKLIGMAEPVELFELHGWTELVSPEWLARRDLYEDAIIQFEQGNWSKAASIAASAPNDENPDRPTSILIRRSAECMESEPDDFDGVWIFKRK